MARRLLLAAITLALAGVFVGFLPLTVDGVGCGSVYHPTRYSSASTTTLLETQVVEAEDSACQAHRDTIGRWSGLAYALAVVALIAGAGARRREKPADAD